MTECFYIQWPFKDRCPCDCYKKSCNLFCSDAKTRLKKLFSLLISIYHTKIVAKVATKPEFLVTKKYVLATVLVAILSPELFESLLSGRMID